MPKEQAENEKLGQTENVNPKDEQRDALDFEKWLAEQPDAVKAAYTTHTSGLRSALQSERETRKRYEAEEQKRAKAGEDAEKARLAEQQQWKELAEKNAKEAEAANRKAAELELRALRSEVIAAKKLPPELAKRLQGTTKEELEADADDLLKMLKSVAAQSQGAIAATPKPDGAGLSPDEKRKQAWRPTSL